MSNKCNPGAALKIEEHPVSSLDSPCNEKDPRSRDKSPNRMNNGECPNHSKKNVSISFSGVDIVLLINKMTSFRVLLNNLLRQLKATTISLKMTVKTMSLLH